MSTRCGSSSAHPAVKAVVIRVESPGGVAPSQEIYTAILNLRAVKPVIASFGGVAASAGTISRARATRSSPIQEPSRARSLIMDSASRGGCSRRSACSRDHQVGRHKDMGSPTRPLTDEERRLFQEMIDSVHTQFVTRLRVGVTWTLRGCESWPTGVSYSGEQAHEAGLRRTCGLEDAIAMAAERGGIEGEPRVAAMRGRGTFRGGGGCCSISHQEACARLALGLERGLVNGPPVSGLQLLYGGPLLR